MEENTRAARFLDLLQDLQGYDHISGSNGYVEYYTGSDDSNIILTAGHGGLKVFLCLNQYDYQAM